MCVIYLVLVIVSMPVFLVQGMAGRLGEAGLKRVFEKGLNRRDLNLDRFVLQKKLIPLHTTIIKRPLKILRTSGSPTWLLTPVTRKDQVKKVMELPRIERIKKVFQPWFLPLSVVDPLRIIF